MYKKCAGFFSPSLLKFNTLTYSVQGPVSILCQGFSINHLIFKLETVKIQDVDCEGGREERSLRGFGALSPQHCDAAEAESCLWKAKSIRPIQRPDPRNTIDMGAVGANMGRYAQKGFWLLRSNFWWHRRVSKRALIDHDPWFKWNAFSS